VVLPDLAGVDDAGHLARKVYAALRQPLDLDGVKLHLEFSVGIGVSSLAGSDPTTLLRQADVAMYRAKRGGGPALYDPHSDSGRLRGIDLAGELLTAIDADQLVLHYQPRIDLRRGEAVGLEALVRWRHPTLGLVLPDLFVPLAETTAAIKPLSQWVLRQALADRRRWLAEGIDIAVAVNVSTRVLHDAELPELVRQACNGDGPDARGLEMEITESAVMADPERALSAMSRLAAAGVGFAIDDFGTGYSSLSYLKRLPARSLKIDKSFVQHMDNDERDASIVRSAIELAHSLGMDVVAEGVERASVRRMLALLRCDEAQGFEIARPMPAHAVPTWVRAHTPTRS
jgi:EAL domain-containing protein (putative c-di-GMP-specific phosphodiesterase class I)